MLPSKKEPAIPDKTKAESRRPDAPKSGDHPVPAVVGAVKPPPLQAKPASRLWLWLGGVVLVAGIGATLYFQPWAAKTTAVVFETAALAPTTRLLAVNGRIEAARSVNLRPLVSGTLTQISVAEGDVVAIGTDLARIDASGQQAVVRQAKAGLDSALVAQDAAQETFDRMQALGRNVAQITRDTAARAVQSAAQEVARATALFDAAQIKLADFAIRAPIAGTVLVVSVDPGQSVDPSTVLMTLADLSQLQVATDVDEAYATQIQLDQPAVLQLAGETTLRNGRVSAVSQRVDAATGGLAVTLAFDQPVTAPVALTVTANIIVDRRDAAITLPRAAIVIDGQGTAVYRVADGLAQRQSVKVIDWPAARLIVTDGVAPGDVVIADATGIADGQPVSEVQP